MKSHHILSVFFLFAAFLSAHSQCATTGTISSNCTNPGTWTLTGDVIIDAGVIVTVNNGNAAVGNNTLTVNGSLDVNQTGCAGLGCLFVGSITVGDNGTLNVASTGDIAAENDLVSGGEVNVEGSAQIDDDVTFGNGALDVSGSMNVGGDISVGGLGTTGSITVSGDLTGAGTLSIYDDSYVSIPTTGEVTVTSVTGGWDCCGGAIESDASIYVDGTLNADVNLESSGSVLTGTGTLNGDVTDNSVGGATNDFDDCPGGTPPCTCTTCEIPFPVELVSFEHQISDEGIELLWSTATEINNEGFYIERSLDGQAFNSIGFVGGNGTTSDRIEYEFLDYETHNNSFYRLRQVDYDGQFEYSPTIFVTVNSISDIEVYPNPVSDFVRISGNHGDVYQMTMFDLQGNMILHPESLDLTALEARINARVNDLPPGLYLLQIASPVAQRTIKLVVE